MGVTLNEAGTLEIVSGAVVNNLILESGAKQTVSAGALAQRVTVNADAGMEIWENGAVNYVIANEAGRVDIASGASVTEVKENGGYVSVEDGADVTFVANTVRDLELANESATAHSGCQSMVLGPRSGGHSRKTQLSVYHRQSAERETPRCDRFCSRRNSRPARETPLCRKQKNHLRFNALPQCPPIRSAGI